MKGVNSNMITFFNRQALYVGYSKEERDRITAILQEKHIPYITKDWHARHSLARGRGMIGQLKQYQITYEVYVKRTDYEECSYLINLR